MSLKVLVQRSFLKRVITAYGSAQIPFQAIHKGFDLLRLHESDDELCCMLSVLKYKVGAWSVHEQRRALS